MLKYTIQLNDSEMFQHMEVIGIDHLEFFRQNKYQIKVDNSGTVKFCFIENFPTSHHINNDFRNDSNEQPQDPMIQCRFNSSIVTYDKEKTSGTHTSFSTIILFPRDALIKLGLTIDKQKIHIERELKKIRIEQARLPKKYFDYSQYENLIDDLQDLEGRRADHITAKMFYENLIVIYCGCYLKFGFIQQDGQQTASDSGPKPSNFL